MNRLFLLTSKQMLQCEFQCFVYQKNSQLCSFSLWLAYTFTVTFIAFILIRLVAFYHKNHTQSTITSIFNMIFIIFHHRINCFCIGYIYFAANQKNIHTKIQPNHHQNPSRQTSIYRKTIKIIHIN